MPLHFSLYKLKKQKKKKFDFNYKVHIKFLLYHLGANLFNYSINFLIFY